MSDQIKAFETEAGGIRSIVFAANAGKARYSTMLEAQDAGYEYAFAQISVRRAPVYDVRRTKCGGIPTIGRCHNPDDLKIDVEVLDRMMKEIGVNCE